MDAQKINQYYIDLLRRFGIDVQIIIVDDPELPRQEILEESDCFTIRLNPSKFLPDLSYQSYVAYNAKQILLPRLVLETKRLIFRRFHSDDAEACFPLLSDEEGAYMDGCKAFTAMDDRYSELMELFTQREFQYVVTLKGTGEVIGTVRLFPDNTRAVECMELGYAISPEHKRKGYAFEILSCLLHLLQTDLQLDMVVAGCLPENTASNNLLHKLGFQAEGIRHKAIWHEGIDAPVDLQYYYLDKP